MECKIKLDSNERNHKVMYNNNNNNESPSVFGYVTMITCLKYYVLKLTQLAIASESTAFICIYCVILLLLFTLSILKLIHMFGWNLFTTILPHKLFLFSPFEIMLLPRNTQTIFFFNDLTSIEFDFYSKFTRFT